MSVVADEPSIETHNKSMLSHLAHVFGFQPIERRVIEAVERSQHQQPDTGPDARFRGPRK